LKNLIVMFNICHQCGIYQPDKEIDSSGFYAICPECGYQHPFRRLPMMVVGGASCAGKSSVCNQLMGHMDQVVILESDLLWRKEFNTPEDEFHQFFETWMDAVLDISQSGRPVVLFGAGMAVPHNLERCTAYKYLGRVHYLALVCDDELLTQRLMDRPEWRGTHAPAFIEKQIWFNNWLKTYLGEPPIELLDTTQTPIEATVLQIKAWIEGFVGE
jgi:hypothetical protein